MQRPLRFASVIVPIVIAACSDAGDGDLFSASKGVGGSSNAAGAPAGISGGRTSGNGGSAVSSGGKSAATGGGAPSPGNGGTGAGTGGAAGPIGGSVNGGSGGSNASSGGSKASSGGTASGGTGGGPGASGGVKASGGSQAATGGSVASGGGPSATGGSFAGNDCQQARAALNDALELAQACDPGSEKKQCLGFVQGECCPVAVNDPDSEATAKFSAALAKWQKACGGAVCLAVLCIEPTGATCDSQGSGSGHCVTGPGFSL